MTAANIVHVSDSHLSPTAPYADENWAAVVEEVRRLDPDLVVHTGDISLDGANDAADLDHARRLLDQLPVRWLAIPGNHDIGDIGGAGPSEDAITDDRRRRYSEVFGDGSWAEVLDGWRIVGIDVQTLASSLDASLELWHRLEQITRGPEPIIVFVHRPLLPLASDETDHPDRYITDPTRGRLLDLFDGRDVRIIASGHVHQWRSTDHGGRQHVWAPSTWATLPADLQPTIGTKVTGIVELTLGQIPTAKLIQPSGLADVMIGTDFESPYDH